MSSTNGTTLSPASDTTTQASQVAGAGDYVRQMEDTAPLDVVDRPVPDREDDDPRAVVRALSERVEVAEDVVKLTARRALIEHMTPAEVDAEREVVQLGRELDREYTKWKVTRELRARKWRDRRGSWRRWLDERADVRDRNATTSDQRWHLRAQRVRKRLTSLDARTATHIRSATLWSNLLIALMVVGLAYTGFVVQHNFVPSGDRSDPLWWLSLGLEALASVALMALMRHDARAALAGIVRDDADTRRAWLVKAGLLLASLIAAAGPSIAAGDLMGVVRTGWAPVLVAAVLLIHDRISRGDAQILTKLHAEADRSELRDLVVIVEWALAHELVAPSQDNKPGEVAPSTSKIASYFRVSKTNAAAVRAEINARAAALTA
ncbi:hypothetical protein [Pseudonocardia sp. N23]|uniref:hypothetical protein n=1 Tax=Pseudonocardia sp. N23 TaxID=1987376 RepID=UPI001145F9A8|nr:hypothetical protein [Pseudonocardia sp. N23]